MKAIVISYLVLALLPFADADEPIANRTQTETAFARELHHATDVAIISRLSSGGYRVLSVIKGESFAAADDVEFGSSFDFSSRIPVSLREEPRLLVWQAGNQCSVADITLPRASMGAVPISASGEVAVSTTVKVSLVSIPARFRPIEVGRPIPHPAAVGPELANKSSRTNGP
jgi:hypothetical protein